MMSIKVIWFVLAISTLFTIINSSSENRWQQYLDIIEVATKEYTPCKSGCTCHADVITNDLKVWTDKGNITKEDMKNALENNVHYQIMNHKMYRQDDCLFPSRCSGVEHFIMQIIDDLPDMEFALNVHDWPKSMKFKPPKPVLSFSKEEKRHWDIMYPAWTFWQGGPAVWPLYPKGLGRWDLIRKDLESKAKEFPWSKKENIGFFRGSRTSSQRDPLILLSREKPELIDAQYTKNQAWKSKEDTLGAEPAENIHLVDHCKYKYLFNFRGVAASFRLKHLFMCDSLVFHVGNDWLEFFYPALKPWVHYIPVSTGLHEVEELLLFAKENDEVVKKIANRGRKFITSRLKMEDVTCYWKKLLLEFSSLLNYPIERKHELKEIPKPPKSSKTEL